MWSDKCVWDHGFVEFGNQYPYSVNFKGQIGMYRLHYTSDRLVLKCEILPRHKPRNRKRFWIPRNTTIWRSLIPGGGTQVYKRRGCAKPFSGFEICDLRTFLGLKFCSAFFG